MIKVRLLHRVSHFDANGVFCGYSYGSSEIAINDDVMYSKIGSFNIHYTVEGAERIASPPCIRLFLISTFFIEDDLGRKTANIMRKTHTISPPTDEFSKQWIPEIIGSELIEVMPDDIPDPSS